MPHGRSIEVSTQSMPLSSPHDGLVPSRPLHELASLAPALPPFAEPLRVSFPMSNDESARYLIQTAARVNTADYQAATNRVALVVGESALAAALPHIPEDTILLADVSPKMCAFMGHYVAALREAPDASQWHEQVLERLGAKDDSTTSKFFRTRFAHYINLQVAQWNGINQAHPLGRAAHIAPRQNYETSSELARKKAIIPWLINLKDLGEVAILSKALKKHSAHITMLNVTNLVGYHITHSDGVDAKLDPEDSALCLDPLPISEAAPILATATTAVPPDQRSYYRNPGWVLDATGPFFGLENFRQAGGLTTRHECLQAYRQRPALRRRYLQMESQPGYLAADEADVA